MGNRCVKSKKKVTLVMVGLDNAGKTTAAKGITGESPEDVAPTLGFSSFQLRKHNYDVTIYDLGGSVSIRGIWRNYLAESFGFIFVVDASDVTRIIECKGILHDLLKNPTVSGKPFLILANKQDMEGALDDVELVGILEVEPIINETRSRTRVETCSALYAGKRRKQDRRIQAGFKWLITTIGLDYDNLKQRVDQDVAVQNKIQAKERKEREERVQKLREERAILENETDIKEGPEIEARQQFAKNGNPFKPISTVAKEIEKTDCEETSVTIHREMSERSVLEYSHSVNSKKLSNFTSANTENMKSSQKTNYSATKDVAVLPPVVEASENGDNPEHDIGKLSTCPSVIGTDNEPIEVEKKSTPHKRKMFGRNNKTAPMAGPQGSLPPLVIHPSPWVYGTPLGSPDAQDRPTSGVKLSWGLDEELEVGDSRSTPLLT